MAYLSIAYVFDKSSEFNSVSFYHSADARVSMVNYDYTYRDSDPGTWYYSYNGTKDTTWMYSGDSFMLLASPASGQTLDHWWIGIYNSSSYVSDGWSRAYYGESGFDTYVDPSYPQELWSTVDYAISKYADGNDYLYLCIAPVVTGSDSSKCYIYTSSGWTRATPYIYTSSGWVQATPYIYNGSRWIQV